MLQSILTKIQMFISTSQGMETPNQYKVKEDIIAKRKSQNQAKPTEKKSDEINENSAGPVAWWSASAISISVQLRRRTMGRQYMMIRIYRDNSMK